MAGVIDADYRGQVGVILANLSETDFAIKVGDRIAQLIVEKVCDFHLVEIWDAGAGAIRGLLDCGPLS
jgi:dUTPase